MRSQFYFDVFIYFRCKLKLVITSCFVVVVLTMSTTKLTLMMEHHNRIQ